MRNLHGTLSAGAAAILLSGCILDRSAGGTGVGNPAKGAAIVAMMAVDAQPAAAKASAAIRNPDGSFGIRDAGGTAFTVRSGHANVGRIKIALPQGLDCSDDGENECEAGVVILRGPWVSDLMTGSWTPDPGAVTLPVGAYRRVDIRLEAQQDGHGAGPDLSRHSLVFGGTFAYQGRDDRPFSIALDFDEEARYESAAGFALDTGSNAITLSLRIADWLSRADLTACLESGAIPLDGSGGFAYDNGKDCDVEQDLKNAVKESGSLHGGRRDEHGERD